ncbi:hypothetical protein [Almyronema epifaneia]|uniref:Uncharacterized protein n=1 Tax=Almyronema epifaneia S1 TaxID=2991925 RepID=A0ABW6IBG1_9CYAN
MYESRKDWLTSAAIAGLGAGVVTTFAVSQGQNFFVAVAITLFAAGLAVLFDRFA